MICNKLKSFSLPDPPTDTTLALSKHNPLSVGDFLNLTCSADSSYPQAKLSLNALSDFSLSEIMYSAGHHYDQKVVISLSGTLEIKHDGETVECQVYFNNTIVDELTKNYTLNVTCKLHSANKKIFSSKLLSRCTHCCLGFIRNDSIFNTLLQYELMAMLIRPIQRVS